MENQKEIWKPIPGYEGNYEFSNLHNVKSLSRFIKRGNGGFWSKERILKQTFDNGYLRVGLWVNGKIKCLGIHQLVAMEHLGHIPKGKFIVVDHKNEIKNDNRLENLQIITGRENINRSIKNSTSKYSGVYLCKKSNKWKSSIWIYDKRIHLGSFDTELEASEYYENALKNHLDGLVIEVKRKTFSSKYNGVSWDKSRNKWESSVTINRKKKHIGRFKTEIEAHNAYLQYINKTL